jgi:competence protein ComEA
MKSQSKYVSKILYVVMFGVMLLANTSLVTAKEKSISQIPSKEMPSIIKEKMVNLNQSTSEELMTLKGIGHIKAEAIIFYREKVGNFKSISELTKVKGIGEKIMSANKTRLSI